MQNHKNYLKKRKFHPQELIFKQIWRAATHLKIKF